MIKLGAKSVSRIHAGNFTHKPAQQRINEIVSAAQERGNNALHVDCHEVYLYLKEHSSVSCTCRAQVNTFESFEPDESDVMPDNIGGAEAHDVDEITFDWGKPLFGEQHASAEDAVDLRALAGLDLPKYQPPGADEDTDEVDTDADLDFDDTPTTEGSVYGSAIDTSPACGICYRTGYQPGLVQYGAQRTLLTTLNVCDLDGYTIDRSATPNKFCKLTRDGYAKFELHVPKYFNSASFSVRNNYEVLDESLYVNGQPLTLAILRSVKGVLEIECRALEFTHVQVVFDVNADPMLANLSQLSHVTDWTQFEAVGSLNIALFTNIDNIPVGSVVVVPAKGFGMRITDVPKVRTSRGDSLEWSCTIRMLQPQEQLKDIALNTKIR